MFIWAHKYVHEQWCWYECDDENQVLELKPQDVVIPMNCTEKLVNTTKYVDDLLVTLYDMERFYNCERCRPKQLFWQKAHPFPEAKLPPSHWSHRDQEKKRKRSIEKCKMFQGHALFFQMRCQKSLKDWEYSKNQDSPKSSAKQCLRHSFYPKFPKEFVKSILKAKRELYLCENPIFIKSNPTYTFFYLL